MSIAIEPLKNIFWGVTSSFFVRMKLISLLKIVLFVDGSG
jgi:hypothetical protein